MQKARIPQARRMTRRRKGWNRGEEEEGLVREENRRRWFCSQLPPRSLYVSISLLPSCGQTGERVEPHSQSMLCTQYISLLGNPNLVIHFSFSRTRYISTTFLYFHWCNFPPACPDECLFISRTNAARRSRLSNDRLYAAAPTDLCHPLSPCSEQPQQLSHRYQHSRSIFSRVSLIVRVNPLSYPRNIVV